MLTYILAFVVGSLQIVSYYIAINDKCYLINYVVFYTLQGELQGGNEYLYVFIGGLILLATGIFVFISWAGSIVYINE
jgi:hypothetical protein